MAAIMHTNTSVGAVNESALCSQTAHIIKENLTNTSTKEGRDPCSGTCKQTAKVPAQEYEVFVSYLDLKNLVDDKQH